MENTSNDSMPRRPFVLSALFGLGIPLLLQIPTMAVLASLEHMPQAGPAPFVLGFVLVNIGAGFMVMTRPFTSAEKIATAFAYIPVMFLMLIMESLYISVYLGGDSL